MAAQASPRVCFFCTLPDAIRTASLDLDTHLRGEVTTLATCWHVRRCDGAVQGFTDHVADLSIDIGEGHGLVIYAAAMVYARSAIRTSARLNVDNLEVVGFFDSDGISEEEDNDNPNLAKVKGFSLHPGVATRAHLRRKLEWL